jgi:hypothetical protein
MEVLGFYFWALTGLNFIFHKFSYTEGLVYLFWAEAQPGLNYFGFFYVLI